MTHDLAVRLRPFLDAGLLSAVPTRWQILQGEFQMWPWVLSSDVTEEVHYRRSGLGHPLVRQPLIFSVVGLDHLAVGTGLASSLQSVCAHLHLTWHQGMPTWDLQLITTHPDGLATLRRRTEELAARSTPQARRIGAVADRILLDAPGYHARFTEPGGWLDRAEAGDWPSAEEMGSTMPDAFCRLSSFLEHCLQFDATPTETGWAKVPGTLLELTTQRFRQRGGLGWFTSPTVSR